MTGLEWPGKSSAGYHPAKPRWHPSYFPLPVSHKDDGARAAAPRPSTRLPLTQASELSPETNAMGGPVPIMDTAISFATAPVLGPPGI